MLPVSISPQFVALLCVMVINNLMGLGYTHKEGDCRCVTIQECGDGGGLIKPRHNVTECEKDLHFCCTILATVPPPPPLPKCGIHEPIVIPGFVYGIGDFALYREFPWHVKILGEDGSYLGSGALIDARRILSVAHIFQHNKPSSVLVGMHTAIVKVANFKKHGDFNWVNLHNDVAMLYLEKELDLVNLFPRVGTVCLSPEEFQGGESCVLSTFGENDYPIVKKIHMQTLPGQVCEDIFRRSGRLGPGFILDRRSFICAGDTCKGHGGSPLVCKTDGSYYLAGLVSWGITNGDCHRDRGDYPGVYTNVARYRGWINRN